MPVLESSFFRFVSAVIVAFPARGDDIADNSGTCVNAN